MLTHVKTTVKSDANAKVAYKFWLARCFRNGSPEEDLFRAVCANSMKPEVIEPNSRSRQPVLKRTANGAETRLSLAPRRKSNLHTLTVSRHNSGEGCNENDTCA